MAFISLIVIFCSNAFAASVSVQSDWVRTILSTSPGSAPIGSYSNPLLTNSQIVSPLSPFGEVITANARPTIQDIFTYGANTEHWRFFINGGGSTSTSNGMVAAYSGTDSTSSLVSIGTLRGLVYRPGQGAVIRFSAIFSTAVAGTIQFAGIGNGETALGFVYDYDGDFKVVRSSGGLRDLRRLAIDVKSSNSQTAVVTLGDKTFNCAVTNGASIDVTAYEIGTCDYTSKYPGWTTFVLGSSVTFIPTLSGTLPQTGFSISFPTSGSGTFSQIVTPRTPSVESVARANWNIDTMDGSGNSANPSGVYLDTTRLNVYQISFQYLGAGAITFSVEDPNTGRIIPVHIIKYANREYTPSLSAPSMPFIYSARNIGVAGGVTLKVASVGGFDMGEIRRIGQQRSVRVEKTGIGTSFVPMMTIETARVRGDGTTINQQKSVLLSLNISNNGTKGAEVILLQNATLGSDLQKIFVSTNTSPVRYEQTATSYSGGISVVSRGIPGGQHAEIDLTNYFLAMPPGAQYTLAVRAVATTTDLTASIQWVEDF